MCNALPINVAFDASNGYLLIDMRWIMTLNEIYDIL